MLGIGTGPARRRTTEFPSWKRCGFGITRDSHGNIGRKRRIVRTYNDNGRFQAPFHAVTVGHEQQDRVARLGDLSSIGPSSRVYRRLKLGNFLNTFSDDYDGR